MSKLIYFKWISGEGSYCFKFFKEIWFIIYFILWATCNIREQFLSSSWKAFLGGRESFWMKLDEEIDTARSFVYHVRMFLIHFFHEINILQRKQALEKFCWSNICFSVITTTLIKAHNDINLCILSTPFLVAFVHFIILCTNKLNSFKHMHEWS